MGNRRHAACIVRLLHPHTMIFVCLACAFFSCDKRTNYFTELQMATLEAFRAVLDDEGTPEIIRNHIIDSLQYTLRNHGQIFTSKEVEWLAARLRRHGATSPTACRSYPGAPFAATFSCSKPHRLGDLPARGSFCYPISPI
jgi:hypothetical protein